MARWSNRTSQEIGPIVARRVVTAVGGPKQRIELIIGKPRRVDPYEWQCPILITGLEKQPVFDAASGVDALQALMLGADCIRWHLKRSGRRFAWNGDSELAGIAGIPRQIPPGMGDEFDARIERAIEREQLNTRKFRAPILRRLFAEGEMRARKRKTGSHSSGLQPELRQVRGKKS
jgi:hypothetical protein